MQVSGQVQKVGEKWESNAGKKFKSPLYSALVEDVWYGFGFNDPKISEGDVVTFDADKGKFGWDADAGSVTQVAADTPVAKAAVQSADARQTSIVYQSQHRDAIETIKFLVEQDAVKLGSKAGDKYDIFLGLVQDLTVRWTKEALHPELEEVQQQEDMGDE